MNSVGFSLTISFLVSEGVVRFHNICNGRIGVKTQGFDFQIEK